MNSEERKLVHQALANEADVETFSEGEGPWRKVVVRPKQKK
jgi:spoIIIJ-associated protein